jgi:hypothetical protein
MAQPLQPPSSGVCGITGVLGCWMTQLVQPSADAGAVRAIKAMAVRMLSFMFRSTGWSWRGYMKAEPAMCRMSHIGRNEKPQPSPTTGQGKFYPASSTSAIQMDELSEVNDSQMTFHKCDEPNVFVMDAMMAFLEWQSVELWLPSGWSAWQGGGFERRRALSVRLNRRRVVSPTHRKRLT